MPTSTINPRFVLGDGGVVRGSFEALRHVVSVAVEKVRRARDKQGIVDSVTRVFLDAIDLRPTSALLINTAREVLLGLKSLLEKDIDDNELRTRVVGLLESVWARAWSANDSAARIASRRLRDGDVVMTISYSTGVLKAIEYAVRSGKRISAYVLESRPGGEGRLIASRLSSLGIPVTLIVDSSARLYMRHVSKVLVGAEAVAANGALVNKIGTSLLALIANEARVRVFSVAATYKFSYETILGELIEIPRLSPETILPRELREAGVDAYVPLFDVTPPEMIDAIATEKGFIAPTAIPYLLRDMYGKWPPEPPSPRSLAEELVSMVS